MFNKIVVPAFSSLLLSTAAAAVPETFLYVGELEQNGAPADGAFSVTFQMFDDATAGTVVYSEAVASLDVVDGALVYELGSSPSNPLDDEELAGGELYLSVIVNGTALEPRVPVRSVPFARTAATLDGRPAAAFRDIDDVVGVDIPVGPSTIGAVEIANNSVDTNKIVNGSVGFLDLAANSVGSGQIASGSVSGIKLKDRRFLVRRPSFLGGGLEVVNDPIGDICDGTRCDVSDPTIMCGTVGGAARFFDCSGACALTSSTLCRSPSLIVGFVTSASQ